MIKKRTKKTHGFKIRIFVSCFYFVNRVIHCCWPAVRRASDGLFYGGGLVVDVCVSLEGC